MEISCHGSYHWSTKGCYILVGKDSGAEFEDSAFTPLRGYLVEKYHFDDGMSEPSEAVNVIRRELSMLQDLVRINIILPHRIRTSEILPCDSKSFLTHVILPRLSREGCTLVVLELKCMVVKWHHLKKTRNLIVSSIKNPLFMSKWDRIIYPSRSPFVITRQAS